MSAGRRGRGAATVLVLVGLAGLGPGPGQPVRAEEAFAAECLPSGATHVTVGEVACQRLPSRFLGAETAFSYYVPPGCDPAVHPGVRCPVLYLLHGTGGSYRSMLGTRDGPSAWVRALTAGPPVDPRQVSDPWSYADPASWVPARPLDLVLVAPHNRTLPGGYGPFPDLDGLWVDWNPRYARGGDLERYHTPPPRFESFLAYELIPFVEERLPVGRGRAWRAIDGVSQGGFGSLHNALQRPDLFSSVGSVSGGSIPLGLAPAGAPRLAGTSPPVGLPRVPVPGLLSGGWPEAAFNTFLVTSVLFGLGDPVADQVHWHGNNPGDLAVNARASDASQQSLHIRYFVNDAVPRRPEDLSDPQRYAFAQGYEAGTLAASLYMEAAFRDAGVETHFEIHPGLHSGTYWNPFLRQTLAEHYAHLRHPSGGGSPPPDPTRFDFRTIDPEFSVWGWSFRVTRGQVEFLNLREVTCSGLVLQGTGVVQVTVPESCGTGKEGSRTFTVDLGHTYPTDDPAYLSEAPAYGSTVRVELEPLP